ncbi:hypothetical protein LS73_009115 [Helicobacter muridarum]|uniref:Outer membrane protein n=1 Tax=Helicobacter muridarum TaxID=216 RepID=A0A377PW06_9HELI|nr:hypothetical protein [Helicobacter muridarum]TLD98333.1 hypothetical protein LS73_009115 [Helicobacter muridarum]STQ87158.1 Uncharacterised protein [Helicobacter muridarum]
MVSNTAVHLGTNLGSLESPILLSFAMYIDLQNADSSEKRFLKGDMFLGANIFGRFILDKDIGFEYGAGYGYSIATRYYGDEFNIFNSSKHNQRFEASLGLIFTQSSNIKNTRKDFYMKVKGLYYINNAFDITTNQGQTLIYPSNKDISVMLETGFSL